MQDKADSGMSAQAPAHILRGLAEPPTHGCSGQHGPAAPALDLQRNRWVVSLASALSIAFLITPAVF